VSQLATPITPWRVVGQGLGWPPAQQRAVSSGQVAFMFRSSARKGDHALVRRLLALELQNPSCESRALWGRGRARQCDGSLGFRARSAVSALSDACFKCLPNALQSIPALFSIRDLFRPKPRWIRSRGGRRLRQTTSHPRILLPVPAHAGLFVSPKKTSRPQGFGCRSPNQQPTAVASTRSSCSASRQAE
jgi:hypothetical protein